MTLSEEKVPRSPLRYPGGKAKFYSVITRLLDANSLQISEYAEPYAGGAGLALALLMNGKVKTVHINDIDVSIYAFWKSVLYDTRGMCARIRNAKLTIDEWRRQKRIQENPANFSEIELGFSTLYLNRTNRSGIIKSASVIGGLAQDGDWRMDVRFNKDALISRIKAIAKERDRINIYNVDAIEFLDSLHHGKRTLSYLDPPYFGNGRRLYTNFYSQPDHERIARYVQDKLRGYWVLSYDDVPDIRELYQSYRKARIRTLYSAATKREASEIIVFADDFDRLIRVNRKK